MKPFLGGFFGSMLGFILLFVFAYFVGSSYPQYGQALRSKLGV